MKKLTIVAILWLVMTACTPTVSAGVTSTTEVDLPVENLQEDLGVEEVEPASGNQPVLTSTPKPAQPGGLTQAEVSQKQGEQLESSREGLSNEAQESRGEEDSQEINPLTGLAVKDPALLALPPALISVTNFPVSARPQAGLSFAPYVYELYIGEGMTRFLAMFYGEYPSLDLQGVADPTVISDNQPEIGPVRSGRLPYQAIRKLYNGFLVMASASPDVKEATTDFTNIYGSDSDDINSALIDVTRLRSIAEANHAALGANLTGNVFSELPPEAGSEATSLWVFYNYYNQVQWTFDPAADAYLRFQDNADGSGKFYPATDRLTGEQLAFENVIVLFVKHEVLNSDRTLIDVALLYSKGEAYLFRDGQVYPIYWTTLSEAYEKSTGRLRPVRFIDHNGEPIPLKPGSTWVEMVDVTTGFREIQPGIWKARFYSP